MRHGGNKLHLQLGELNRSRHPHSLDGPNRCDGGDERNRQDPRHAENGAPRSGVDVRKLLGSLLVIDQLDLREILTNAVKGCDALGEIAIHSLLRAPFKNRDRKSTRLNSSHGYISYAVFCLKKTNQSLV